MAIVSFLWSYFCSICYFAVVIIVANISITIGIVRPGLYFNRCQSHSSLTIAKVARVFILELAMVASASAVSSRRLSFSKFNHTEVSLQSPAVVGTLHPTACIRSRPMQTRRPLIIKHLKLQFCVRRKLLWLQRPWKEENVWLRHITLINSDSCNDFVSVNNRQTYGTNLFQIIHWQLLFLFVSDFWLFCSVSLSASYCFVDEKCMIRVSVNIKYPLYTLKYAQWNIS